MHTQLHEALEDLGTVRLNESNAAYEAIHRSILSGLLGHVATKAGSNIYKAAGNRQVMVFPGSALFERSGKPDKTAGPKERNPRPPKTVQPAWIMAGEMVETSQLFARTLASIEPEWILQLAPHLCKITHFEPHWSASAGRVLINEKAVLYGLEIYNRKVAYANLNPVAATEIFIRSALVEEDLMPEPPHSRREKDVSGVRSSQELMALVATRQAALPANYRFVEHNRRLCQKIELLRTRTHRHGLPDPDQALLEFYSRHIQNVSALHELNQLLRSQANPNFLCATEEDLLGKQASSYDTEAFPDAVPLGGQLAGLSYAYAPGEERDGVTIQLGLEVARDVSPASLQWAVPGFREEQIQELLRALPRTIRRELMPLPQRAAEIARELQPGSETILHDLAKFIQQRYGLQVSASTWPADALPAHLRPRLEIVGKDQKSLATGRDLDELREKLKQAESAAVS
ncbi:MAG TPA: DUF3418 domain-containing protein, partial [Candidatus Sulfotelmatobacter sp.]|nr:DUF3418 domain-containing protein [Candidatus Sulfotelmatobacter sp.]